MTLLKDEVDNILSGKFRKSIMPELWDGRASERIVETLGCSRPTPAWRTPVVRIDAEYLGDLRCAAVHGPSSNRLTTDAPADNHGKGEYFSPTDLVATALGTCMVTIMGIAAQKHGWKLAGTRVEIEKRMAADPARRIGEIEIASHVAGEHDEKARKILERSAEGCPVLRSLHPDVKKIVRFHWGSV